MTRHHYIAVPVSIYPDAHGTNAEKSTCVRVHSHLYADCFNDCSIEGSKLCVRRESQFCATSNLLIPSVSSNVIKESGTSDINKDGRHIVTTFHCTKLMLKYGHEE